MITSACDDFSYGPRLAFNFKTELFREAGLGHNPPTPPPPPHHYHSQIHPNQNYMQIYSTFLLLRQRQEDINVFVYFHLHFLVVASCLNQEPFPWG